MRNHKVGNKCVKICCADCLPSHLRGTIENIEQCSQSAAKREEAARALRIARSIWRGTTSSVCEVDNEIDRLLEEVGC